MHELPQIRLSHKERLFSVALGPVESPANVAEIPELDPALSGQAKEAPEPPSTEH